MLQRVVGFFKKQSSDFLFTEQCAFCSSRSVALHFLCTECIQKLNPFDAASASVTLENDISVVSLYPVNSITTRVVHHVKYKSLPRFGRTLIRSADQNIIKNAIPSHAVIIPVPLHSIRKRERGYNQAYELAHELALCSGAELSADLLKRVRYTKTQTRLNKEARSRNMDSVFKITKGTQLKGKTVIVVDDVYTTGATVAGCVQVLMGAKPEKIIVCTLLRTSLETPKNDFLFELALTEH